MGRPPCCDKLNVKKGPWSVEEDAKLLAYTSTHGTGNWTSVPKKAGLKRCGKSCRLRWTNYLRPNLKHESFTPEEEEQIINLHATIGSRWSIIANSLPGRTDNDIKNYWNTKLSKKLRQKGIDPVTHRPISEVYHNIGILQLQGKNNNNLVLHNKNNATKKCTIASSYATNALRINQADDAKRKKNTDMFYVPNSTNTKLISSSPSYHYHHVSNPNDNNNDYLSSGLQVNGDHDAPVSPEFKWSDFLVDDFTCTDVDHHNGSNYSTSLVGDGDSNYNAMMMSKGKLVTSGSLTVDHQGLIMECYDANDVISDEHFGLINSDEGSSSSFVDAMLDQHREEVASKFCELLSENNDEFN